MNRIKKKWRKWFTIPLAVVLALAIVLPVQLSQAPARVYASDVAVTGTTLTGQDTTLDFTLVQFDMSWDYSWRDSVNRDAVWVFVKYRVDGGSWAHATLSTTSGDHSAPTGFTVDAVSDGMGVFIYRDGLSSGTSSLTGVQLQWDYGTDGVGDNDLVEGKVFAIEMVYIPQDSFWVGDADNSLPNAFFRADGTYTVNEALGGYQVTSEGAITVGTTDGNLYYDLNTGNAGDQAGPIQAAFPKGYNDFYMMKYEVSQGQYAEFLNTLTTTQATARFPGNTGTSRQYIELLGSVYGNDASANNILNETNDGEWVAANFLTWTDGAAYVDWAGLRPMTELEFEKAARGNQAVLDDEYVWGTTVIVQATGYINAGATNEVTSNAANAAYGNHVSVFGPLRNGAFTDADDTRQEAGASYYGVMELSGNLFEIMISVGSSTGRAFTGLHGDGTLDASGDANVTNWPGTDGVGLGMRGGSWNSASTLLHTADRTWADNTQDTRSNERAMRGVRTAP